MTGTTVKQPSEAARQLAELVNNYKGGISELVSASGVSRSTLRRLSLMESDPTLSTLEALSEVFGEAAIAIQINSEAKPTIEGTDASTSEQLVSVPHVMLSTFNDDQGRFIRMPMALLLQSVYSNSYESTRLVTIDTEAMSPEILPEDTALVDMGVHPQKPEEGVYVIRIDEHFTLRRIAPLGNGSYRISSANEAYPTQTLKLAEAPQVSVVGRVSRVTTKRI